MVRDREIKAKYVYQNNVRLRPFNPAFVSIVLFALSKALHRLYDFGQVIERRTPSQNLGSSNKCFPVDVVSINEIYPGLDTQFLKNEQPFVSAVRTGRFRSTPERGSL